MRAPTQRSCRRYAGSRARSRPWPIENRPTVDGEWETRAPYGSTAPRAAFYLYSPDRKAERAHALLKGCRGHLHADAYAGFAGFYEVDPLTGAPAPLTEVACWAHARCKI